MWLTAILTLKYVFFELSSEAIEQFAIEVLFTFFSGVYLYLVFSKKNIERGQI